MENKKKTLDILIPQYHETDEVVKPLLDSIAIQQNVDFGCVRVIICNDGSDTFLSEELVNNYPFRIDYYHEKHRGVSATRNACLDHSKADYVMFCDADDMFCHVCGLFILFREMNTEEGFDSLVSVFMEENHNPETGDILYVNHNMDSTFVHGKVHRRQYLLDQKIRWNDNLFIHEDSYFNCLCQKLSENVKFCPMPFYLWKWREESVCRHDPLYLNKTLVDMFKSNTALVNQFLSRDREDLAQQFATSMIYDSYYSFNCDRWWNEEGHPYLEASERRFKKYWTEFKPLFDKMEDKDKLPIIAGIKNRFFQEGLMMERITFDDWIKKIESLEEASDEEAKEIINNIAGDKPQPIEKNDTENTNSNE